jgi:uncharacterized protein YdaT
MSWSSEFIPAPMRALSDVTRAKAIEMANALLQEDTEEGKAIHAAVAKTEEWAAARGVPAFDCVEA